jgi:hypothetical protein
MKQGSFWVLFRSSAQWAASDTGSHFLEIAVLQPSVRRASFKRRPQCSSLSFTGLMPRRVSTPARKDARLESIDSHAETPCLFARSICTVSVTFVIFPVLSTSLTARERYQRRASEDSHRAPRAPTRAETSPRPVLAPSNPRAVYFISDQEHSELQRLRRVEKQQVRSLPRIEEARTSGVRHSRNQAPPNSRTLTRREPD